MSKVCKDNSNIRRPCLLGELLWLFTSDVKRIASNDLYKFKMCHPIVDCSRRSSF